MHLKIIAAGPKCVGKTLISNLVAGQSDSLTPPDKYTPTAGVRILEFSAAVSNEDVSVELWDMSGDSLYEGCWRTIMQGADGVLLVYNPDAPAQEQQIADWFDYFVRRNDMKDDQCILFAHRSTEGKSERFRPPPLFSRVNGSLTTTQSSADVKNIFDNFVKELHSMKRRK